MQPALRLLVLLLVGAPLGCGISGPVDDFAADLGRSIGPSSVDSAMLLAKGPVRDTFRAVWALPQALQDPPGFVDLGYDVDPPDASGRRAWRSTFERYSHDENPIVVEGAARPLEGGGWVVDLQRVDEPIRGSFLVHAVDAHRTTWAGSGTYDGPWSAATKLRSGPDEPFAFLVPPVSPGIVSPYEFAGCLHLEVEYWDDVLEGRLCHDGDGRFTHVIRNGVPDPNGVDGDV